jgi:protein-disulfide isomerase
LVVVEFADLECPSCKRFHTRLKQVEAELRTEISSVLLHYPLSNHRFAMPAARALECADRSGAAERFVAAAYAKQDSFGLKPWSGYAGDAGISDTASFVACTRETGPVPRVERGLRLGKAMDIQGTPLIIINGWRFQSPPGDQYLREVVHALLEGKPPPPN